MEAPRHSPRQPALLCEQFPAYPGLLRIRLDHFLWFPSRIGSTWDTAAADCIGSGSINPEQSLAYVLRKSGVPIRMLGAGPMGYVSEWSKQASREPHATGIVWHAHNTTSVLAWLEAMEARHRSEMAASSRAAARMVNKSMARAFRGAFLACTHHQGQERVDRI